MTWSDSKLDLPFPLHKETKTIHSTQLYTQVFHLISEHREVISETREGVPSDIQIQRSNTSNTRRSVSSDI